MPARAIHFVGSLPPDIKTPSEAMRFVLDAAGPHLDGLMPTGETNRSLMYTGPIIVGLAKHPALLIVTQGDWSTMAKRHTYALRPGHSLREATLDPFLGYSNETEAAWPAFQQLLPEHPHLRLQVGIPAPLTLSFMAFDRRIAQYYRFKGPPGDRVLPYYRPVAEATVREVARIRALAGEKVVFQLELTLETLLPVTLPPGLWRLATHLIVGAISGVVAAMPSGIRMGLHLCYGSMHDQPGAVPESTARVVALANALARRWPAGRDLVFVHMPMGAGPHPPLHEAYYAPLATLKLPPQTRLIAGLVHEEQPLDEQRRALGLVEDAVGHRVDVACACGLGRRPDKSAALAAIRRAVELVSEA